MPLFESQPWLAVAFVVLIVEAWSGLKFLLRTWLDYRSRPKFKPRLRS